MADLNKVQKEFLMTVHKPRILDSEIPGLLDNLATYTVSDPMTEGELNKALETINTLSAYFIHNPDMLTKYPMYEECVSDFIRSAAKSSEDARQKAKLEEKRSATYLTAQVKAQGGLNMVRAMQQYEDADVDELEA